MKENKVIERVVGGVGLVVKNNCREFIQEFGIKDPRPFLDKIEVVASKKRGYYFVKIKYSPCEYLISAEKVLQAIGASIGI